MINHWITADYYDFLYLVALSVAWFAWRTARARFQSGNPWRRDEIISYGFLIGGAVVLVIAGVLDSLSPYRLPVFVFGIGCMIWAFLTLRKVT